MIEAAVPAFRRIISPSAEVVQVLSGMGSLRGIVCSRTGIVYFADITADTVYEYAIPRWQIAPDGGVLGKHPLGLEGAFGLTLDHQGRLLIAGGRKGTVSRIEVDGSLRLLIEGGRGGPQHPADLIYAIDGNVYVTDLPALADDPSPTAGGVYQITPGGAVLRASSGPLAPAALALDSRQLHLFLYDRLAGVVQRFPLAPDGALGPPTTLFEPRGSLADSPGGLETDEEGNIYVATTEGVLAYNNDGIYLGAVRLPEPCADLCWGRGGIGLYVTAGCSVYFIPSLARGTRTF